MIPCKFSLYRSEVGLDNHIESMKCLKAFELFEDTSPRGTAKKRTSSWLKESVDKPWCPLGSSPPSTHQLRISIVIRCLSLRNVEWPPRTRRFFEIHHRNPDRLFSWPSSPQRETPKAGGWKAFVDGSRVHLSLMPIYSLGTSGRFWYPSSSAKLARNLDVAAFVLYNLSNHFISMNTWLRQDFDRNPLRTLLVKVLFFLPVFIPSELPRYLVDNYSTCMPALSTTFLWLINHRGMEV